jgi:hypothetical protein
MVAVGGLDLSWPRSISIKPFATKAYTKHRNSLRVMTIESLRALSGGWTSRDKGKNNASLMKKNAVTNKLK